MDTILRQYANTLYLKFPTPQEPEWIAYDVPLDKAELLNRPLNTDEDYPE